MTIPGPIWDGINPWYLTLLMDAFATKIAIYNIIAFGVILFKAFDTTILFAGSMPIKEVCFELLPLLKRCHLLRMRCNS